MSAYGLRRTDLAAPGPTEALGDNLRSWLSYGFAAAGGLLPAATGVSQAYGGDPTRLRPVVAYGITPGTVWQGPRADWAYEPDLAPPPSGVWVGPAFRPFDATCWAHLPAGRVQFTTPVPTGTTVRCEHVARLVQVRPADEPWQRLLERAASRADRADLSLPPGSGLADADWRQRLQAPFVVVDPLAQATHRPLEVGNAARYRSQRVDLHVLADTPTDLARLHDALVGQRDEVIPAFGAAPPPLDALGRPVSGGALSHPARCSGWPAPPYRVVDADSADQGRLGPELWWATVRWRVELLVV